MRQVWVTLRGRRSQSSFICITETAMPIGSNTIQIYNNKSMYNAKEEKYKKT